MVSKWDKNEGLEKAVTDLWTEGLSALTIASRLGHGLTRNAVVAKIHRLRAQGMQLRGRPLVRGTAMAKKPKRRRASNIPGGAPARSAAQSRLSLVFSAVPFQATQDDTKPTVKEVIDLEKHHCRWPIGEVGHSDFGFCGQTRFMGLPYCQAHCAISYQAPVIRSEPAVASVEQEEKAPVLEPAE